MGRLLLLVGATLLVLGGCFGDVWEFGSDSRRSVVVATSSGDISIFEKNKRIQFTVPACYEVVYVRVQVDNDLTTPAVNYEKDTHTVIIHYKLLQSSFSKYNIVAKAIEQRNCGSRNQKRKSKTRSMISDLDEDYGSDEVDYRWMKPFPKKTRAQNDIVIEYQAVPVSYRRSRL